MNTQCLSTLYFLKLNTVSASSDYLRCTVANPKPSNTIDTIHYLLVGLHSVHRHFGHLQIPVDDRNIYSVNMNSRSVSD